MSEKKQMRKSWRPKRVDCQRRVQIYPILHWSFPSTKAKSFRINQKACANAVWIRSIKRQHAASTFDCRLNQPTLSLVCLHTIKIERRQRNRFKGILTTSQVDYDSLLSRPKWKLAKKKMRTTALRQHFCRPCVCAYAVGCDDDPIKYPIIWN